MYERPPGEQPVRPPFVEDRARLDELFRQEEELGKAMDDMIRNASDRLVGERRALEEYAPKIDAVRQEKRELMSKIEELEKSQER